MNVKIKDTLLSAHQPSAANTAHKRGFALISTIAILSLTTMIALAFVSLSSSTIQSSENSKLLDEARANARLALSKAIAHLQRTTGSDTRITAPANSVAGTSANAPRQLTGAWRSWEGLNHDTTTGLPLAPDYVLKQRTHNSSTNQDARFLGWLISSPEQNNAATNPPLLESTANTVPLLSTGSLGAIPTTATSADFPDVHIIPTAIKNGSFAYWIQGENTKALLKQSIDTKPSDDYEWQQRLASYSKADSETFLDSNLQDQLNSIVSLKTLELVNSSSDISKINFHDITHSSRGLLTNVSTGGWKRDFSTMAEKWDENDWYGNNKIDLPVFTTSPDQPELVSELLAQKFHQEAKSGNFSLTSTGAIYPWTDLDHVSLSWNALLDYVSFYKRVKVENGEPYFDQTVVGTSNWNSISPINSRLTFLFEYQASENSGAFTPLIGVKPSLTVWNPYNVAIKKNKSLGLGEFRMGNTKEARSDFPIKLFSSVGGTEKEVNLVKVIERTENSQNYLRLLPNPTKGEETYFRPGASLVYGKSGYEVQHGVGKDGNNQNWDTMEPGYSNKGSWLDDLTISGVNGQNTGSATDEFSFRWEPNIANGESFGHIAHLYGRLNIDQDGTNVRTGSSAIGHYSYVVPEAEISEKLYLPELVNDDETLESAKDDPSPFLAINFGLHTLQEEYRDGSSAFTGEVFNKGYFEHRPISIGLDSNSATTAEESLYRFEFFALNDYGAPGAPQSNRDGAFGNEHSGYVGTSMDNSDGLERFPIAELPTQPLLSLCELQHFNIAYWNQAPPFAFNSIGNSHASAFLASEQIQNGAYSHDHSYAANHILFDDWFFSSITPQFEQYTQTLLTNDSGEELTKEQVYAEHLSANTPLRNSSYVPANTSPISKATIIANATLADENVWQTIASELEIDGMFNVNSTSVQAWKSLLMSQRNTSIPTTKHNNSVDTNWTTELQPPTGTGVSFSRTTVAAENVSSDDDANAVAKPLHMTEDQVEDLAELIVEQVKQRGPFLSLSEFMNRQLDASPSELTQAGTVEAALLNLSKKSGAENPYSQLINAYPYNADTSQNTSTSYQYPEANIGSAAYGTPGWARQADVLRHLAPILSARDDTFKVRAYGSATKDGVTVEVWCEAIVQRKAEYVDSSNSKTQRLNLSSANSQFGRKFTIQSFRWLTSQEV